MIGIVDLGNFIRLNIIYWTPEFQTIFPFFEILLPHTFRVEIQNTYNQHFEVSSKSNYKLLTKKRTQKR